MLQKLGGQSQCLAPSPFPSPWWEVGSVGTSRDGANTCSEGPCCKMAPVWKGGWKIQQG